MARAAFNAILAASAVLLTGCGTVGNFIGLRDHQTQVYGGVKLSASTAGMFATHATEGDLGCCIAAAWCALVDVPLSAVGDTLTLPWSIQATLARDFAASDAAPAPAAATNQP